MNVCLCLRAEGHRESVLCFTERERDGEMEDTSRVHVLLFYTSEVY